MFLPNITANGTSIIQLLVSANNFPNDDNDVPLWAANGWTIWLTRIGVSIAVVLTLRVLYVFLKDTRYRDVYNSVLSSLGIAVGSNLDAATLPETSASQESVVQAEVQAAVQAIALVANQDNPSDADSPDTGVEQHRHEHQANHPSNTPTESH